MADPVFDSLPFDVIVRIFTYLSQQDCLTCMTVSRSWDIAVPQYCQEVWSTLRLSENNVVHTKNSRWERSIGSHVKRVIFRNFSNEQALYSIMQKLIDCQCNRIEEIAFSCCSTPNQDTFAPLLQQLGSSSATELKFSDHDSGLAFLNILNACPQLSAFWLVASTMRKLYALLAQSSSTIPGPLEFTNLTHLFLDVEMMDAQQYLAPVLQKSPNLRYLSYGSGLNTHLRLPSSATIDLDLILSWCPKLVYVASNCGKSGEFRNMALNRLQVQKDDAPGLRAFMASETCYTTPGRTLSHLGRHTSTLESLFFSACELGGSSVDWSPLFANLQCPNLHTLVSSYLTYDGDAMDKMIRHCPALERLIIYATREGSSLNLPNALRHLKHLRYLRLNGVRLQYEDAPGSLTSLFRQLSMDGSKLNDLTLVNVTGTTDELLRALPCLPALESLKIQLPEEYTDDALGQFVQGLRRTSIRKLYLSEILQPPPAIVRALGDVASLEQLALYGRRPFCMSFDPDSLLHIFRNLENLKTFEVMSMALTNVVESKVTFLEREAQGYKVITFPLINDYSYVRLYR